MSTKKSITIVITFYDRTSGVKQKVHGIFQTPENEEMLAVEMPSTSHWGQQKHCTWHLPSPLFPDITTSDVQCSLFLLKGYFQRKKFLPEELLTFMHLKQQNLGFDDIDMNNIVEIVNYLSGGKGEDLVYVLKSYIYEEIADVLKKNASCVMKFNNPFNGLKQYNLYKPSKRVLYDELFAKTWTKAGKFMEAFIVHENKTSFQAWVNIAFCISNRKLQSLTNQLWDQCTPYNAKLREKCL